MVSKPIPLKKAQIKYKGVFDKMLLLKTMRTWFNEEGYDTSETTNKHKKGDLGWDDEIKWEAERRVNHYVKFYINIFVNLRDVNDIEAVRDGKKQLMQDGKVLIETTGKLELDWDNRFGGNRALQLLQEFYHDFIIKKTIGVRWWDHLYYKIYKLNSIIRGCLGFETAK